MKRTAPRLAAMAVLLIVVAPAVAADFRLAPFKDELFRYPRVIASEFGGDFMTVSFDYGRDVVRRDQVPEERTRPQYVLLDVNAVQSDRSLQSGKTTVRYFAVGKAAGKTRMVVVFIHGLWATRFDGVDDWKYGGNLNRIKNLMALNDGVYLTPDFSEGRTAARRQVGALLAEYARFSPDAPMILICASLGGTLCVDLVRDADAGRLVDGLIFVASAPSPGFLRAPAVKDEGRRIPVYIAAGTGDPLVSWQAQERFFRALKASAPGYPVKLVLFKTGAHRASLRMIDWRLAINWMLDVHAGLPATAATATPASTGLTAVPCPRLDPRKGTRGDSTCVGGSGR